VGPGSHPWCALGMEDFLTSRRSMIEPDELRCYAVSATGLDLSNTCAVICYNKLYWRRPDTMREYKDADRTRRGMLDCGEETLDRWFVSPENGKLC